MMKIKEFEHLKEELDIENPFIPHYVLEDGSDFYIEPIFYTIKTWKSFIFSIKNTIITSSTK